ncbi:lipopolysaccharide biosynthesis protein [Sulfitobacter sp. 1A12779]|uniref:lipopolysaccharide biosynthesis protein n=1 Tax=Sulfitobacter sp. 1A12779 TaxID=3368599 RepID=UPI003744B4A2
MTVGQLISSYPVHRTVVAGLTFVAAILAARLLPAADFAALMTAAFMAKCLQLCNLGATNGYFVSRYSGEGPLAQDVAGAERRYLLFFLLQMLALGVVVLAVALWLFPQYRIGALAFLLIAPIFAVEPYLRYRRNFSFSLMPDLLLSIALLTVVALHIAREETGRTDIPYLSMIAALTGLVMVLAMRQHLPSKGAAPLDWRGYGELLALGMPVYVASFLFVATSSMDRLILPLHGADEQVALYFLGHQLSVGAMIFLTAINFINTVNLGEARKQKNGISTQFIFRKLLIAAGVGVASFFTLVAAAVMLEDMFLPSTFEGLTLVVVLLGFAFAVFFVAGSITPLAAYYRRQLPLTFAMGFGALMVSANNLYAYHEGLGAIWLAGGTSIILTLYAAFALFFVLSTVKRHSGRMAAA